MCRRASAPGTGFTNRAAIIVLLLATGGAQLTAGERPLPLAEAEVADKTGGELGSLLGKKWEDVWAVLRPQGVTLVKERAAMDGRVEHMLRGKDDKSASFSLWLTDGRVDEVVAWSPYELKTIFPTVVGSIAPGIPIEQIEKKHGKPILVEHGTWPGSGGALRMKGWMVGNYLIFVTNASGQRLGAEPERVYAFRKDLLPKDRRLFTDFKVTLEALARGEKHIETPSSDRR